MERTRSPNRASTLATLASVPWCCVVPAGLSLLSLSGALAARLWLVRLAWVLLPLSIVLMGRALWLTQVRRRGKPWARWTSRVAAVVVIGLWTPRLLSWLS